MIATRSRLAAPLALLALLALAPAAPAQLLTPRPEGAEHPDHAQRVLDLLGPGHVVREAWRLTGRYIYDRERLGPAWDELDDRYAAEAARARTPEEVHALINRMLGELGVSHLALMEQRVWARELENEFADRPVLRAGCELAEVDGRLHVAAVAQASAAAAAGLRVGDEVVAIDGVSPAASGRLDAAGHDPGLPGPPAYFLRVDADARPIALTLRRQRDGAALEVALVPSESSLIEAVSASARVVEVGEARVGVIHLWHFMHPSVARRLRDALAGPLADADALVLDLRGRGGRADVVRAVLRLFVGQRARWKRPVVCLIDGHTRSAKEVFSWHWRQAGRGPLVGERTQGACIGCRFVQLSDGSVLMVPAADVRRMSSGEVLEGNGVHPTLPVAQLPLPYRDGADAILEAGLREAARQVEAAKVY